MVFIVYTRLMVNKSWPPPGCTHHCRSWRRSWHTRICAGATLTSQSQQKSRIPIAPDYIITEINTALCMYNADRKSGHAARITHCKVLQERRLPPKEEIAG